MKLWHYIKHSKNILSKYHASPIYLVFFVTDRCNANCKHCLLGDTVPITKNELTVDEIEKTAKTMGDLLFLLPTGGQPFLRKDLAEIVKIFYKETNVRNVGIPTNGTMPERTVNFVKDVMSECPEIDLGIDVSIDGPREIHDDIRGVPGLFDKAVGTYNELRKLEKEYAHFNVNVETTVSSYNEDHLNELYDYVTKNLDVSTLFTLLTRGRPKDPATKFFNVQKYQQYADRLEKGLKSRALSGYHNFPFCDVVNAKRIVRHRLIAEIVDKNEYQIPCYAGRLGGALLANGDVLPCELLYDKKLGNIRDHNYEFREIWFSDKAREARKWIHDTKCFCTYECFHSLNITFNPTMYPKLFKEWFAIKASKLYDRPNGATVTVTEKEEEHV